ncbi:Uncharacterised nucleotidyltransferase [Micromonospora sediminicola]|uniref:Uncharacterized nucleotidyltransferase n=1 Tax=Micromonospora sediminicola TaxID=946078 RepID=A0A1A9B3S9_9ACTN|nr:MULTISPECIES: nucleotidyltransferase family protein [Micromonospora]PGH41750.1 hypothetical protein COO58_24775 [Micromonospora sp. WMMA1996]SBT63684.1 Uncharacterised nucleotidyltransferase [Micromonospora sediminicola]
MAADRLSPGLLRRLLDVEEHRSDRALLRAARDSSVTLPHLVLSLLEREGTTLGSGSSDELRRARQRAARYRDILTRARELADVRVLKGPSLAARYPAGVLRPVGDLDLVVADEAGLWRVAHAVLDAYPVEHLDLTLLRDDVRQHVMVGLSWPADDPLLDRDVKVELSTTALPGNGRDVPARRRLPDDPWLADLLTLAEEGLQRRFTPKDVVDVLVLIDAAHPVPDDAAIVAVARDNHLAPELAQLLARCSPVLPADRRDGLDAALACAVAEERARRAAQPDPADPSAVAATPEERLRAGQPVYGMVLRRATRPELTLSRLHTPEPDLTLLRTPVADALMVTGQLVDSHLYDRAQRALATLDGAR